MRERRRMIGLLMGLSVLLAGCGGGSGSTGLITSESVLIDEVRRTGTCSDFDGAPYCATDSPDATDPGGRSASIGVAPSPTPMRTPGVPSQSPTAAAAPTATPAAGGPTSTAAMPTPSAAETPMPDPTPSAADPRTVTATLDGFEPGAACAIAARPAASADPWHTGGLVPVDDSGDQVTFTIPASVAEPFDAALLCFAEAPAALAPELTTLADAEPTVVFVLPSS